ncbi:MAG: hypothetical protein Q9M29_04865, partial [Mariprofundaceae bacterium]|nr:hypothetical protein [Mariprofundaceae bacterium]
MSLSFAAWAVSAIFVVNQPWLGVKFSPAEHGLYIEGIMPAGPAVGILVPGDVVTAIGGPRGSMLVLEPADVIEDPDELSTFAAYKRFLVRQTKISHMLHAPVVRLGLEDGRLVRLQPADQRPLLSLPPDFWMSQVFAMLTLMISAGVWGLRREAAATRLLLVSGLGLFMGSVLGSLYMSRELALEGEMFAVLSQANSLFNRIFAMAGLGLMWCYPGLVGPRWIMGLLAGIEALWMFNMHFQWLEPPLHAYYADYLLLAIIAFIVGLAGWLRARSNPLHRSIIKLLLFPIFMSVSIVMMVFVLPTIYSGVPLISAGGSYMLLLGMYIGLALGVARFRLFDIERWWISIWFWFFVGAGIVLLDITLVAVLPLDESWSMLASLLIFAWLYFPLRQWVWGRFLGHRERVLDAHIPKLISYFIQPVAAKDEWTFWKDFLSDVFLPASAEYLREKGSKIELAGDGVCMRVPSLDGEVLLEMRLPDRGGRLFTRHDADLAGGLLAVARQAREQSEAYVRGMEEERRRIMRDLHDEVGGRLLTLTHTEGRDAPMAAEALRRLREIIYSLDAEQEITLNAAVARW